MAQRCQLLPGKSGLDVTGGLILVLRNRTPSIEGGVASRSGNQAAGMAAFERFETNMCPNQHKIFHLHNLLCKSDGIPLP